MFNALDLMENKTFLEKLKFGIGDGNLQYYLYNWKCPSMGAEKVCTFWAAPPLRSWQLGQGQVLASVIEAGPRVWDPASVWALEESLPSGGHVSRGSVPLSAAGVRVAEGTRPLSHTEVGRLFPASSQLVSSLIQWDRALGLSQDTGQSHARGLPGRESLTRAAALAPAWPFLHQLQGAAQGQGNPTLRGYLRDELQCGLVPTQYSSGCHR